MEREAIEKIEEMSKPNFEEIDGVKFSDKKMHKVKLSPVNPDTLELHTLTGIVDYCRENLDDEKKLIIHVLSYREVNVYGELNSEFGIRKHYLRAIFPQFDFSFGQFYDTEMFNIKMQTQFIKDDTLKSILKVVGNVQDENITTVTDDGITQQVTAKAGVVNVENIDLPNPVYITPMRTFPEINQIETSLVLRGKKSHNGPNFALFEADGCQWKVEAILRIKRYLSTELPLLENNKKITIIG